MTNDEMLGLIERLTAVTRDLWDASSVNVPRGPRDWIVTFGNAAMDLRRAAELLEKHADHPPRDEYIGQLPTPPSNHPDGFRVPRKFPSGFLD